MFASTTVTEPNLQSATHRRRLLDNESSRHLFFALAKTEPANYELGYPKCLLQHAYLSKTGDSNRQLDRKRFAAHRVEDVYNYNYQTFNKPKKEWKSFEHLEDIGPSSLQIFSGEDVMKTNREKINKNIQKKWLELQMAEKIAINNQQKQLQLNQDRVYNNQAKIMDYQDKQQRQKVWSYNKIIEKYNKEMSVYKSIERRSQVFQEENIKNMDKIGHIQSNILNDRCSSEPISRHTFIPQHLDQTRNSANELLFQQKFNIDQKNEPYWEKRNEVQLRRNKLEERQQQRSLREQNQRLMLENIKLSQEQKMVQAQVYQSLTEDDFYEQFGKTYR